MFVLYKMPRKSASKKQRGGSLASDRVMKNLNTAAVTHDYVVSPRIRTKSNLGNTNTYQLTGGACGACGGHKHVEGFRGCGATAPTQVGGSNCHKKEEFGNCGGSTAPTQVGGSNCHKKEEFGNCKYQDGGRRGRNSIKKSSQRSSRKRNSKVRRLAQRSLRRKSNKVRRSAQRSSRRKSNKVRRSAQRSSRRRNKQKGGGSAWMASQYSLSLADKSHARTPSFSHSKATPKSVLLNPPNMGLAGSGMGDLYSPFAPAQ